MTPLPGDGTPPPASLARRHFMNIAAAGAARLSAIAISSVVLAKSADAMGLFPRDDPRVPDHHCYRPGTLIQTPDGEVSVEELAVGDMVLTTNGAKPVQWIGRRSITKNAAASWHPSVLPIRVTRFAIDDRTPHRNLYLSQGHSLLIDGFLIPVKHLVNGSSIVVDRCAETSDLLEYLCVKLDTHEAMFAEGLPAETFRHDGGQIAWDNLGEYEDLYGFEHEAMTPYAPLCTYKGGRAEVNALLRLAASPIVDLRDPIQVAYARIASRAMSRAA